MLCGTLLLWLLGVGFASSFDANAAYADAEEDTHFGREWKAMTSHLIASSSLVKSEIKSARYPDLRICSPLM